MGTADMTPPEWTAAFETSYGALIDGLAFLAPNELTAEGFITDMPADL